MTNEDQNSKIAKKFGIITPPVIQTPAEQPSQISQIFTGWANYVKDRFDALDPKIKELSESRLKSCDVCHMRSGLKCLCSLFGISRL